MRDAKVRPAGWIVAVAAAVLGLAVSAWSVQVQPDRARDQSVRNLRLLAVAMHTYANDFGHLPPPAIRDIKTGKALLSWRVLLLPYILGNEKLYQAFKKDEPWDSPHNLKLLPAIPNVFESPDPARQANATSYQLLVGPAAVFDPNRRTNLAKDIPDGLSQTLLIVEAASAIPWTRPDDLPYDPNKDVPSLGFFPGGFHAAMCDGSVKFFSSEICRNPKDLHAVIGPRDGVNVDLKRYWKVK